MKLCWAWSWISEFLVNKLVLIQTYLWIHLIILLKMRKMFFIEDRPRKCTNHFTRCHSLSGSFNSFDSSDLLHKISWFFNLSKTDSLSFNNAWESLQKYKKKTNITSIQLLLDHIDILKKSFYLYECKGITLSQLQLTVPTWPSVCTNDNKNENMTCWLIAYKNNITWFLAFHSNFLSTE